MANRSTKDWEVSTKASSGSESGVRKFTLSCSRCRASKLKCDREEPCTECVTRKVGHLCTKDERQPRAKRTKTDHINDNNTKNNASQNLETEAEEAAQVLEHFVNGTSRSNVYSSVVFEPTVPFVAPDYSNMYWSDSNDSQRQTEKVALIREIVDAMPELDMIHSLYKFFVTRCQGALGNVVHTPSFRKQAESLVSCLGLASPEAQAMALSNAFSMDTLACHLLALVLGLAFHPTPSLLGWSPSPLTLRVEELRASGSHSKTWRSLALRCLQGGTSLFCGSVASLQGAIMLLLDGQERFLALDAILVTAISGAQKLGLHRLGDARLEAFASHTTSENNLSIPTDPPHIRTETGIRIWWALVMRDWSRGEALGYYSIRPSQFNTRMPLHLDDDDLCPTTLRVNEHGYVIERPRSEFTMLSYTVYSLEIAVFMRESIDLRNSLTQAPLQETAEGAKLRTHLNKKYETFVAELPSYFRLGSTMGLTSTGLMAGIPIHRWMLHQQLWSLLLRLHRASVSSEDDRTLCHLLAQNIISTQAQIQVRCAVCGSLSTNGTQLFNAAIVLLIDLLFTSKHKDADRSSAQLNRLMTIDKIREATDLLRTQHDTEHVPFPADPQSQRITASTQRSVIALEALSKLEEEEYSNNEDTIGAHLTGSTLDGQRMRSGSSARKSLKRKVLDTLEALQGNAKNTAAAMEQPRFNLFPALDTPIPLPIATDYFQGIDVLPVLSNDPSSDLWQFFDFSPPHSATENEFFSATTDLQTPVDPMPFRPPSEFADRYSNPNGTCVMDASPPSIETQPTRSSGASEAAMTPSSADVPTATEFY